jgi:hypothetical protein
VLFTNVDELTADITLSAPIGETFLVSDKSAIIFPLAGLSGDPTLISESDIGSITELYNVIAHELGHTCGNLKDVSETGNIMYGIAQSGVPPLTFRRRGVELYYDPSKKEEQWLAVKR